MVENLDKDGLDLRNYGEITGLASCRKLGSQILGCTEDLVWAGEIAAFLLCPNTYLSYLLKAMEQGPGELKSVFQFYAQSLVMIDILSFVKPSVLI